MRTRSTVFLVLAALVVGVGGTAMFFTLRDDSGSRVGSASTTSSLSTASDDTTTDPVVAEFLALLDRSGSGTYHARYSLTSPALEQQRQQYSFELWRKDGLFRADTTVSGAQSLLTRALQAQGGSVVCQNSGDTAWACKKSSASPTNPTTAAIAQMKQLLSNGTVTVQDATIAGTAARCFTVTMKGTSSAGTAVSDQYEICLTTGGVTARSSHAGEKLELVSFDDIVPDVVFTPPAPISD